MIDLCKVTGYKVNIHKPIFFLYNNNKNWNLKLKVQYKLQYTIQLKINTQVYIFKNMYNINLREAIKLKKYVKEISKQRNVTHL